MEIRKEDILTPANAVSALGAALTVAGAANIDRVSGVAMIGVGRALDLLDGPVARRTHSSEFGAAVDGTLDKVGVAAMVVQGLRHEITHPGILLTVAAFQVVNGVTNTYIEKRGQKPKTSMDGKHAMFAQNVAIGGFALAYALGGNTPLEGASALIFGLSTPTAIKASYGYTKQALAARTAPQARTKNFHRRKR